MGATDETTSGGELVRLVGLVLLTIIAARAVGRTENVLGLVALAAMAALVTAPLMRLLARRVPRGAAAALTALVTFVVVVALTGFVLRVASVHVAELSDAVTSRLDDLRSGTLPDRVARSLALRDAVDDTLSRLPASVLTAESDTIGVARRSIDALLIVILAAFFQAGAPGLLDAVVGLRPRAARPRLRALATDVERRAGSHVRRSLLVAGAVWVAVGVAAALLGVPGPVLLGAWAAAWSIVPWLGAWVGLAPFVLLASGQDRLTLVATMVVAIVVALVFGRVRRTWTERGTVVIGPFLGVLAFAAGSQVAGPPGALMAFSLAAVAAAVVTSDHRRGPDEVDPAGTGNERRPLLGPLLTVGPAGARVAPGWRGALTVLAGGALGALVWMVLTSAERVLTWVVIAALVAVAADRLVGFVHRRARVARPVAIGVVCGLAAVVLAGVALLGGGGAAGSSARVTEELPRAVSDLESLPVLGPWLREREASVWVSDQLENLPQRLSEVRVDERLPSVGARMLDLGWTLLLALALLVDGPRLAGAAARRIPARHRRQVDRLSRVSHAAIAGYLAGAALVAGLNAAVVLTIAVVLGIALAPVLAVWAFVWNFVPQIGGFMGGFPLVVLALAKGPGPALVAGLLFVTYQFVENHLIQPAVISEAIDIPASVALLAALAGGAVGGVVGAVVLTPLVGVVRVAIAELRKDDFPGTTVRLTPDDLPMDQRVAAAGVAPRVLP